MCIYPRPSFVALIFAQRLFDTLIGLSGDWESDASTFHLNGAFFYEDHSS